MNRRILYFHTGSSSFVNKDQRIFSEIAELRSFSFTVKQKWKTPFVFLRQLLFLLKNFPGADLYISQFAGYHSFLPGIFSKLTGKKHLIIAGGTDCVSYPHIAYGNFYRPLLRLFTTWSYKLCSHISPKHISLWHHTNDYDPEAPQEQGIKAFLPGLQKPVTAIPNGYDLQFWKCGDHSERKRGTFITVTAGMEFPFQGALKGIDLILKAAPHFPDCDFTIVGVPSWKKFPHLPANIRLVSALGAGELKSAFCSHQFYLQISLAEGFPNALCEAMLCGCIPIGSAVYSIPELIGKNGFILQKRDPAELIKLLENALRNSGTDMGVQAGNSIANRFPIENRRSELRKLCLMLMNRASA